MKKVLLCPPTHFDIEYEINPWMHVENKVEQAKVQVEFAALKKVYTDLEVEMLEIPQEKGLPDMVYAANYGSPTGSAFIKSNYKYNERKKEAELAKEYFKKLGFSILKLPEAIAFEGQGDLLTIRGEYFFGWGKRSDYEAKEYLHHFLGKEIHDFRLIDPYYYHLDTCFTPLDEKTVMINPRSFEPDGIEKIKKLFPSVIITSEEDNNYLACNAVVVGKSVVIAKGITQQLKDNLSTYGYTTIEVPMDEFRKGGGSVKCLTLEFY